MSQILKKIATFSLKIYDNFWRSCEKLVQEDQIFYLRWEVSLGWFRVESPSKPYSSPNYTTTTITCNVHTVAFSVLTFYMYGRRDTIINFLNQKQQYLFCSAVFLAGHVSYMYAWSVYILAVVAKYDLVLNYKNIVAETQDSPFMLLFPHTVNPNPDPDVLSRAPNPDLQKRGPRPRWNENRNPDPESTVSAPTPTPKKCESRSLLRRRSLSSMERRQYIENFHSECGRLLWRYNPLSFSFVQLHYILLLRKLDGKSNNASAGGAFARPDSVLNENWIQNLWQWKWKSNFWMDRYLDQIQLRKISNNTKNRIIFLKITSC